MQVRSPTRSALAACRSWMSRSLFAVMAMYWLASAWIWSGMRTPSALPPLV
jgi:hypothetical protein